MNSLVKTETTNNFDINNKEDIEIQSGQYWRLKKDGIYKKGLILLLVSVNIIDDILHSVEFAKHPVAASRKRPNSEDGVRYRVGYDDLIESFDFVPLEEALAERELEIAKEEEKIEKTREALLIGYIDEESGIKATELISSIVNKDSSSVEQLPLKIGGSVRDYKNKADQITEIANKQKEFIGEKNEIIRCATTNLASYYQEKGDQALASVDSTMKYVVKLSKGIKTLSLFTGSGVKIEKLRSGEDAAYEEPVTFYQRKLFFDEETYFDLSMKNKDTESLQSFSELLEEDITYIDRIIPAQRGVVLMQYRRKNRSFLSPESIKSTGLMENSRIDEVDESYKIRFLLIRNGENVYKVDCEDFFEAQRLFPTAVEMDSFFKSRDSRSIKERFSGVDFSNGDISPNDLEYVEARDRHDAKAIFYKRVLIILSGIHSREPEIFGNFSGSRENVGAWYNLNFQQKSCRFVYDDEDALDDNIESIESWLERKQKEIMSGSRLLCRGSAMINEESAPMAVRYVEGSSIGGGYSRTGGDYVYFTPKNEFEVALAFSKKSSLFVKLDCEPTFRSPNSSRKMIDVDVVKSEEGGSIPYVVLDAIKKSELDYYLNSRKQRENYLEFADLLLAARKYIDNDEKEQQEFIESFKDSVFCSYPDFEEELLLSKMDEAIRLYRVGNKGETLPKISDENFKRKMTKVSKILHKLLYGDSIIKDIIYKVSESVGKRVLRISINNKGDYLAYLKKDTKYSALEEKGISLEAHVYKVALFGKNNKVSLSQLSDVYYEDLLSEKVIYIDPDYHPASSNDKKNNPYMVSKSSFDVFADIDSSIDKARGVFKEISEGGIKIDTAKALLKTWFTKNKSSKRYYRRIPFYIPISLIVLKGECIVEGIHKDLDKKKDKAFSCVYASVNDIGEFISQCGDEESLEYVSSCLTACRLTVLREEFKENRQRKEFLGFALHSGLSHFNEKDAKKISSSFGFYREDFYRGRGSHYVGRFHNVYNGDIGNGTEKVSSFLSALKKEYFKKDDIISWKNGDFRVLNTIEEVDALIEQRKGR